MFKSIQWRIAISYVLLILISIGTLGSFLVIFAEDQHIDDLRSRLEGESRLVGEASLMLINGENETSKIDSLANTLSQQIDARVTIISKDGTVLGDSEENLEKLGNHSDRPEVQDALKNGFGESTRHSDTLGQKMMYVAIPFERDGVIVGIARIALPTAEIHKSTNRLITTIGIAMGIATFLAILVALHIARITSKPIKAVTAAAKRISNGEINQKIYPSTKDETAELASAFNDMASNLQSMIGELNAETNKLAAVLGTMDDGVIMTDIQGIVLIANPAAGRMFGFVADKAAGSRLAELIPDREINDIFKSYLRTGEHQAGQVERQPNARLLRVIASGVRYHEAVGALLVFQDLTEVKRLKTLRQRFIGNISHELRTPLASIKAVVETLKDGAIHDESVASDFMDRIDTEIDRMTQMIRELAELSRIETGQIELKLAPVNIETIIDLAIAELKPQADRKGIMLEKQLSIDLQPILAEDERILQVLANLIHNAIKFTPSKGKVTISATSENNTVVVSVADTGTGIHPDDLPHVFIRFYKADKARSTEGTGLGLAIAKHIVQAHKGEIWVDSIMEQGSVFSFRLPAA